MVQGAFFPGQIIQFAPNSARPRPTAPPDAPTRPARGMSEFWIRQVFDLLGRRCKISPSSSILDVRSRISCFSIFGIWGRRSKKKHNFLFSVRRSKNTAIVALRVRRSYASSIFEAEDCVEDRHGLRNKVSVVPLINNLSTVRCFSSSVYLSSPKSGHTTGGSCRHGAGRKAGRGDAGQNKGPTCRSPWKPTALLAIQRNVNKS